MSNMDKVLAALPPKGGTWVSPQQVADATGIRGYSTVTRWLRELVVQGKALVQLSPGRSNVYQAAKRRSVKTAAAPVLAAPAGEWPIVLVRPSGGGEPVHAELRKDDPKRPHVVKVVYLASRTAAWIDRSRIVEEPDQAVVPAALIGAGGADNPQPEPGDSVWAATRRAGINYHAHHDAQDPQSPTRCNRSTMSATSWRGSRQSAEDFLMEPCPRCFTAEPAESPVEPADPSAATDVHAQPGTPSGGSVAAVLGYMEQVRPVSAPPVPEPKAKRARRDPGTPKPKPERTFVRGELRDLVLGHLRAMAEGADATASEIAKAIGAPYTGPVSSNLVRMCKAGTVAQTCETPARYRAA